MGEDTSIIGYDDSQLAEYLAPLLTIIHQPKGELEQLAAATLI